MRSLTRRGQAREAEDGAREDRPGDGLRQLVSGSSGMVGGSSPVASFQAATRAFCAAAAASTAEPVPMIFHAREPTPSSCLSDGSPDPFWQFIPVASGGHARPRPGGADQRLSDAHGSEQPDDPAHQWQQERSAPRGQADDDRDGEQAGERRVPQEAQHAPSMHAPYRGSRGRCGRRHPGVPSEARQGSARSAESAGNRRPSNLIRVMPAKGVELLGRGRSSSVPRPPS